MAQLPVETFYVPVQEMAQNEARVRELLARGCSVVPVLPRIIWDREQKQVVHQLEQCKRMGCTAALCGNIAQPKLVQACGMAGIRRFWAQCMERRSDGNAASDWRGAADLVL